jgi:hypothetical protein
MKEPVECIRCHARMEVGYLADSTYGGYKQQSWCPGPPQRSVWTGLKVDTNQSVPVSTLRCPGCGYLESYAAGGAASDR